MLPCLRNVSDKIVMISVWSKDPINLGSLKFFDDNQNEYKVVHSFCSDTKRSIHLSLEASDYFLDVVSVNIKDSTTGEQIARAYGGVNPDIVHVVSCDHPGLPPKKYGWGILQEKITQNCVVLHAGDQVYADPCSVKDEWLLDSYKQIKAAAASTKDEWKEIIERTTIDNFYSGIGDKLSVGWHLFMWDDHEVRNAFRTEESWFLNGMEDLPHTQGAIEAYAQCQVGRPAAGIQGTKLYGWGNLLVLMIDQRAHLSLESIRNGKRWLTDWNESYIRAALNYYQLQKRFNKNIKLVISLPGAFNSTTPLCDLKVFFEERLIGSRGEIDEACSSLNCSTYDKLIKIIDEYIDPSDETPVLTGGDVHLGAIKKITTPKNEYVHIISSGIRTQTYGYEPGLIKFYYFMEDNFPLDKRLSHGVSFSTIYRSFLRNFGTIDFSRERTELIVTHEAKRAKPAGDEIKEYSTYTYKHGAKK